MGFLVSHQDNWLLCNFFLPELEIQFVFSKFSGLYKIMVSVPKNSTLNFMLTYKRRKEEKRIGNQMDVTPEVENKVTG